MVSVLTIVPKVRVLRPGRGDGFSMAIKICNTPSSGEEVKPSAPYHEILQYVKDAFELWTKILRRLNS
jgi:hypothetical protein